ncbi:ubiquinol-cytochrome c reductase iron-sulfur subunit [Panacagrimonas sp.]|uniref:ubiquinol-cytochrome c reductase iron-sulfur subunit n=1 Tax=Panacagrimonas sp. TaxID=2480088 RepID=UPI003B517881
MSTQSVAAAAAPGVDPGRRRFLTLATSGVGAIGAGFVAWPFLASLKPSERAKALGAPVTVDVSALGEGQLLIVGWRGKPVWIVKRTPEMIASLSKVTDELADPDSEQPQQPSYITGAERSIKPELLVMIGSCTHLGCSPSFRPNTPAPEIAADWQGGFYCPCHGSKFDLSGRVYAGVPAPINLAVPPHRYDGDNTIVIGEDPVAA